MAKYTPKGSQATKPQRPADHDRILAGNPYSRRNVDERHLTEIPGPVSELECPERPAHGWEKRGLPDGRFWWFHPEYAVRARMWQFKVPSALDTFTGDDDGRYQQAYGRDDD